MPPPFDLNGLSRLQRALLATYVDAIGKAAGPVGFYSVGGSCVIGGQPFSRAPTVVAEIPIGVGGGDRVYFYGSLGDSLPEEGAPRDHEHEFIGIYDARDLDLARLMAFARAHHALAAPLDAHHSFLLDEDSGLRGRGYTNVLVTRADLYAPFSAKNDLSLDGTGIRLLGLVPLTPSEWKLKVDLGIDALLDSFEQSGRDMLALLPSGS